MASVGIPIRIQRLIVKVGCPKRDHDVEHASCLECLSMLLTRGESSRGKPEAAVLRLKIRTCVRRRRLRGLGAWGVVSLSSRFRVWGLMPLN